MLNIVSADRQARKFLVNRFTCWDADCVVQLVLINFDCISNAYVITKLNSSVFSLFSLSMML